MFWWYWSVRRRLLALAVLVVPVLVFFGLRTFTSGSPAAPAGDVTSSVPSSSAVDVSEQVVESIAVALEVRDDESRAAAAVFPTAFGAFPPDVVQTRNLVFPGMAPEEYAFYAFVGYGSAGAAAGTPDASTTSVPVTSVVPAMASVGDVLDRFTSHFRGVGALVTERESRTGTQLEVTGIESGRGYRTTLSFFEVTGGVVVRGVVIRVPANEVADLLEEAAPSATTGEGSAGGTPATPGEAASTTSAVPPSTTTP